jgi:hypothetical protein
MQKEFVPYGLALKLKQLGFNEECLGWYPDNAAALALDGIYISKPSSGSYKLLAYVPLFQQAFRWFRDEHELHYDITLSINSSNQLIGYYILIHKLDGILVNESNAIELDHNTPNREEAELACLEKMIEILEKK